jgi:hypothetical protein
MTEAVIALPVLVILLGGTLLVGKIAVAKADAESLARGCAWQYSMNACDAVPPGCEGVKFSPHSESVQNEISDKLDEAQSSIRNAAKGGVVGNVVEQILGTALGAAFGSSIDASASENVTRPKLFGKDPVRAAGAYHLACNLKPRTMDSVAMQAWKIFRP